MFLLPIDGNSYYAVRAMMATLFHAADIACGENACAKSKRRAEISVAEAEMLLAELGIVNLDTVVG